MPRSSEPLLSVTSVEEVSAVLRETEAAGQTVSVRGSGTKLDWPTPAPATDVTIDMRRMDRIVEHASGDLVVTAQAGVPLQALQDHVAGSRQWLALDPPETDATVGGVVAAAASGPRRLLYGTPRDLLIGLTIVLADGTIAHSGGKVVKNVAGYDLGKLFTGSFGTLGVIAQCTFRLHPVQRCRRVVVAAVDDVGGAVPLVKAAAVPAAIEWDGRALTVVIESIEAGADAQAAAVVAAIGGSVSEEVPDGFGERPWRETQVGLKVTHPLSALAAILDAIAALLPSPTVRAHAGSGVVWVAYDGDGSPVEPLRQEVAAYDGQVVVTHAPPQVKAAVDVWGPARGLPVMRRIKDRFDPDHRLAPGTFVGGL